MINSSILIVNNVPEYAEGITGGAIVSKRNEQILRNVFKEVHVYNHIYNNKSKIKILLQAFLGISLGLTKKNIKTILQIADIKNCEYIFLGYSTLGAIAKKSKKQKKTVITFFHNVEYNYFKKRIANSSLIAKLAGIILKNAIKNNEKKAIKYSDKIIVLNERDSSELKELYNREGDIFIPITFTDNFDNNKLHENNFENEHKKILFVGSDFFGNTEGLFWFIENCLDSITADLIVVGSGMDKYINKYKNKNVVFKGFVDDLAQEYYSADLVVLPILSGSGMKTKTCEALMYGKTIIATKEAFEGYSQNIFEKKAGYICNDASEFIEVINKLLQEQKSNFNQNSRKIFEECYETDGYVQKLENLIQ